MNDFIPEPVAAVDRIMQGFRPKWCIAGGWAVDASLGRVTRSHSDVEVAVFRDDQHRLFEHLEGRTVQYVVHDNPGAPGTLAPWQNERLDLPVHEIHARSPDGFALEVLLNERTSTDWVFRRDQRITLPLRKAILKSDWGIPNLTPEIVLLYKAKDPRDRDQLDFQALLPHLTAKQSYWLREAISLCHPPAIPG